MAGERPKVCPSNWPLFALLVNLYRMNRHLALKVVKSTPRYTATALDKIKLLQRLITSSTPPITPSSSNPNPPPPPSHTHAGRSHVISFLDHFHHKGPNGIYVCMVFEVLGENPLGVIKRHQNKGVPMPLVKQIAKRILLRLDYMHRCCSIIHTGQSHSFLPHFVPTPSLDLKPENVLICIDDVESIISTELATSLALPKVVAGTKHHNQSPFSSPDHNLSPHLPRHLAVVPCSTNGLSPCPRSTTIQPQ